MNLNFKYESNFAVVNGETTLSSYSFKKFLKCMKQHVNLFNMEVDYIYKNSKFLITSSK